MQNEYKEFFHEYTKQNIVFSISIINCSGCIYAAIATSAQFTAIGAMAIFGGAAISEKKYAFLLPLAALLLSDVALQLISHNGFYDLSQLFVYAAFVLITWLATFMKSRSVGNIALAAIWSGAIFFVVSNFGTWVGGAYYPRTAAGLAECFTAAIPFYQHEFFGNFALNYVYGNLFFGALLFSIYAVMEKNMIVQKTIA